MVNSGLYKTHHSATCQQANHVENSSSYNLTRQE